MKIRSHLFVVILLAIAWVVPAHSLAAQDSAAPDYANPKFWVALPSTTDKPVDVFYMHPTTYMDQKDGMVASLDNKEANEEANGATERQASVYAAACNLYAPRYRQASLAALELSETERARYLDIGLRDMREALIYYLEHLNQGRPFILAGHSQGSNLLLRYPDLTPRERLVAVYIIGWSVTDRDLKQLKLPLGNKPDRTGCVLTWNTIADGAKSPVIQPGARCVNPLNWSTGASPVPAELNIYGLIKLEDGSRKRIPHFTGARVDRSQGGLVIPVPAIDKELNHVMGPGVYHAYDYDFFYGNLRENVGVRCDAWLKRHKQE